MKVVNWESMPPEEAIEYLTKVCGESPADANLMVAVARGEVKEYISEEVLASDTADEGRKDEAA